MDSSIESVVLKCFDSISSEDFHRFNSWNHCFGAFKSGSDDVDFLALHLAFYLASWGMYRGSSGLLWKDYKVHVGVVKICCKPEYDALRCYESGESEYVFSDVKWELVTRLRAEICSYFMGIKGGKRRVSVTDTLFSKILLGVFGCVPAYDRFFVIGLGKVGFKDGLKFGFKSLKSVSCFVDDRIDEFRAVQKYVCVKSGVWFPLMKVVDMYFWQLGVDE